MKQSIFSKLSNLQTEKTILQRELSEKENEYNQAKKEMLKSILDEVYNGGDYRSLIWNYAVRKNHGMDIDMEDYELVEKYTKMYIKDIYCFNVDNIELNEEEEI